MILNHNQSEAGHLSAKVRGGRKAIAVEFNTRT